VRAPAALLISLGAGGVDEDAPHHPRRHREEVRAVRPCDALQINKSQVRFVHEGRRLKAVAGPLTSHVFPGNRPQLALHPRHETVERFAIAPTPRE
jgi:hypothetical protein